MSKTDTLLATNETVPQYLMKLPLLYFDVITLDFTNIGGGSG